MSTKYSRAKARVRGENKHPDRLYLILTGEWCDKIASGEKTHEFRHKSGYWVSRIERFTNASPRKAYKVILSRGYRGDAPKLIATIESITTVWGSKTDLKIEGFVYDIALKSVKTYKEKE